VSRQDGQLTLGTQLNLLSQLGLKRPGIACRKKRLKNFTSLF
jgi:hypothetical protein